MSNGIIVDTSYFDGVDLDKPSIRHPVFEKMQANAKSMQLQNNGNKTVEITQKTGLDDDLNEWLIRQDVATKRHINAIIRHAMQMQMAV